MRYKPSTLPGFHTGVQNDVISLAHRLLVVALGSYIDQDTGSIIWSQIGNGRLLARAPSFFRKTSKTTAFPMVYGYRTMRNDRYPWSRTLIRAHVHSTPMYRERMERSRDLFSRNRRNAIRFVFPLRLLLRETAKDFPLCSPERGCRSSIISKRRFLRFFLFSLFLCASATRYRARVCIR